MELDIRSVLPEPLLALPAEQRAAAWGDRNLQRLDGVGAFVRCLMPVQLSDGGKVTYSVWLRVHPDQLSHAHAVWATPGYLDLELDGTIANPIRPWPQMFDEPARARVTEPGTLPYLQATRPGPLSRILAEVWDRDYVLSRIAYPLPVSVRDQLSPEWSIERTAGLAPRIADGMLILTGPGRTVHVEPFGTPATMSVDDAVADMLDGAPPQRDGELAERDVGLLRHALWLSTIVDGRQQFELYGTVAVPGALLLITCMYDDAADLAWAQHVWRSIRHHHSEA